HPGRSPPGAAARRSPLLRGSRSERAIPPPALIWGHAGAGTLGWLPHSFSFGTAWRRATGSAISGAALGRRHLLYPLASLDLSGQWPVSALEPGLTKKRYKVVSPVSLPARPEAPGEAAR